MKNQFPIIMFGLLGLCICACLLLVIVFFNTGGRRINPGSLFNRFRSAPTVAEETLEKYEQEEQKNTIRIPDRFKEVPADSEKTPERTVNEESRTSTAAHVQKYFSTFPCSQIISGKDLKLLLKDNNLFCRKSRWSAGWANPSGKGLRKRNEGMFFRDSVVIDSFTNLMWQRYALKKTVRYSETAALVETLNTTRWQGHDNWRLPKIEEIMATFRPRKNQAGLYLPTDWNCRAHDLWSCNVATDSLKIRWMWVARTALGRCNVGHPDTARSLLVVREM